MRFAKKLRILSAVIITMTLTGCGINTVEVRDRTFIRTASFSMKNDSIRLSLYPFGEESEAAEGIGKTTDKALENASVLAGRDIFMGHLELICFDSTDFTKRLDTLLTDYRISPSCRIIYLDGGEIKDSKGAEKLSDMTEMMCRKGIIPETDLFSILAEKAESDGMALVPTLTKKGIAMCIMGGDRKPYYLSERAAAGLCWLRGDNYPESISIQGENGAEDYEVTSAHTELSAEIRENIPYVTVNIQIDGNGNAQAAESVIKALCKSAEEETMKRAKADVIGFGRCLRRDCAEYYREQEIETAVWAAVFEYDIHAS